MPGTQGGSTRDPLGTGGRYDDGTSFASGAEGDAARQKHWNKRVEEAVDARKEFEGMSESLKQQAAAMRELQNSPEFLDFYNRMRSGDYVVGQSGLPNPQAGGTAPEQDPFEDFDPLTADASQYGQMIESKVGALLDEKLGQLAGVIKPMAEFQQEQVRSQQDTEIESLAKRFPDFESKRHEVLADMSQLGITAEKAYYANKGNGITTEQADALKRQQQPTIGGYGSPPRGEEKSKSFDDALTMNASDGVVDAVLSGQLGT